MGEDILKLRAPSFRLNMSYIRSKAFILSGSSN